MAINVLRGGLPERVITNRRQFILDQIRAGNIDPNNEFIQNIFRNLGG